MIQQQYKTKEFWLQVQKEFKEQKSTFLCWGSDTFADIFESGDVLARDYFKDMVEKFFKEQPQWTVHFKVSTNFHILFSAHKPMTIRNYLRTQIREEFVDWMVKTTSNE